MTRKIPLQSFGSLRVRTPFCLPGQRIGVMGGTFNPPHDGHRIAAEAAMKRLKLDQLWWLITPGNPLKSPNGLSPLAGRMGLVRKFARGPKMKITGFERELGTRYTAGTLSFLKRRYPAVRFVWVMGADNLASVRPLAALAPHRRDHADSDRRSAELAARRPILTRRPGPRTLPCAGIRSRDTSRPASACLDAADHPAFRAFLDRFARSKAAELEAK